MPLMGSFLSGFFGRAIGPSGAGIITLAGVLTSLSISFFAFFEVGLCGSPCYITYLTWFNSEFFVQIGVFILTV
jgi:NADH:ubiquinone oxidoreductase subunit 5 (subunit L)/multisubunit Na+/H+ antiporter MnhA subunit